MLGFPTQPRPKNHRLTERDIHLLKLLSEYGCVDPQRIKAKLWNGNPTSRAHYRRLGILKRLGLIENVIGDQGVGIGYRVSRTGQRILEVKGETIAHAGFRRRYRTQFEHDQLLIDIRPILEKSPVVKDFKTDAAVHAELLGDQRGPVDWKKAPTIPDGTFIYDTPAQRFRIALELEVTQKSKARYFKIFRSHLLNRHWSMAFYIVRDQAMRDRVLAILEQVKAHLAATKLLGAGGGGYLLMFAKDDEAAVRIRLSLTNKPPNPRARFVNFNLSSTGLQVTRS